MEMKALFSEISFNGSLPDGEVSIVTADSRKVVQGAVFVCIKGRGSDGHSFARQALADGAIAIVTQENLGLLNEINVEDTRKAYAVLCQSFFGYPSRSLRLVAVTGTNGKTTVTTLIKEIVEKAGFKAGLIGTIHTEIDSMELPSKYTTPEPWDMAALLSRMVAAGCTFAIMEASSQALDQLRLWGLSFEVGVFTNLTQDHLDYHITFENYFIAKKSLFAQVKTAIVNIDDEYGKRLCAEGKAKEYITLSIKDNSADYTARDIKLSVGKAAFVMLSGSGIERIAFPMPGEFSVYNAMSAAAAAVALGIDSKLAASVLSQSRGVRGRCEVLYDDVFTVLCDFAHTGDAIDKVLSGISPFVKGKLYVLFGCAGERDAAKRPLMSAAAAKYADFVILTSDNPRKENPYDIIKDTQPTLIENAVPYLVETERRSAVCKALEMLHEKDVLMLCGKGHEDYQAVDGVTLYLDEHTIVSEWLQKNGYTK
ncbi:MAG: UDP-N-acetylmuramoyl-L-alanyl-D-glutamate--2,6-diaminopimelate ligase [Oscillospiraceae bacterium]